jgi:hypothetical protein
LASQAALHRLIELLRSRIAIRIKEEMLTAPKILHPALPKMMKQSRLPQCLKL